MRIGPPVDITRVRYGKNGDLRGQVFLSERKWKAFEGWRFFERMRLGEMRCMLRFPGPRYWGWVDRLCERIEAMRCEI